MKFLHNLILIITCYGLTNAISNENKNYDPPAENEFIDSLAQEAKFQLKRGATATEADELASAHQSNTYNNQQNNHNYQSNYAFQPIQYGSYITAAAAVPQFYYVKPAQQHHPNALQYPQGVLKFAVTGVHPNQQIAAYTATPYNSNGKGPYNSQHGSYPQFIIVSGHQQQLPQTSALTLPTYKQQQNQQITGHTYQHSVPTAVTPQPHVHHNQHNAQLSTAASTNNIVHHPTASTLQPLYFTAQATHPAYQTIPYSQPTALHQIQAPQKLVAYPSNEYKQTVVPSLTENGHVGATSYATFAQHLPQHLVASAPTAVTTPVLPTTQHYYSGSVAPATYSQKITYPSHLFGGHNDATVGGSAIHYGTHLYHPTIGKYGYAH